MAAVLLAGCTRKPELIPTIPLYPGHVAKAQGRLFWFPATPNFDEQDKIWVGRGRVEITSCINDPWPEGPGGKDAIIKTALDRESEED